VGLSYVSVVIEPFYPVFGINPMVLLSLALFAGIQWFLYHTRAGLVLRAVGESPQSAHAIGYPVVAIRYLAVLFGGACAGLGGAYLSIVYNPSWVEGMTAGRGWIALALVVFATWRPLRVLVGAYLFGGMLIAQLFVQGAGIQLDVPAQALAMLPYIATVVVLVLISRDLSKIRLNSPVSLGQPYRPDA
jgi:simple sugar transport system permease protein